MVDLDELERLEREATPGPWDLWDLEERGAGYNILAERVIDFGGGLEAVHSLSLCRITEMDRDGKANLDLLIALRNAAPALFAELRTLRARVAELERDLQRDEPRAALAAIMHDLDALMRESEGVAGLHLNGDVATWEELETTWLPVEAARECAAKFERDARLGQAVREAAKQTGDITDVEVLSDDDLCRGVYLGTIVITEHQFNVLRAIDSVLREEEGEGGGGG